MSKSLRRTARIAFVIYCGIMAFLLFARGAGGISEINLVPFKTIGEFWRIMVQSAGQEHTRGLFISAIANLGGNVVLFVPLGFFPPLLWRRLRSFWRTELLCAGIIVAVELLQYGLGLGNADIDDFILNIVGSALGYWLFVLCRRLGR